MPCIMPSADKCGRQARYLKQVVNASGNGFRSTAERQLQTETSNWQLQTATATAEATSNSQLQPATATGKIKERMAFWHRSPSIE